MVALLEEGENHPGRVGWATGEYAQGLAAARVDPDYLGCEGFWCGIRTHLAEVEVPESVVISSRLDGVVVSCDRCVHVCGEREGTSGILL